MLKKPYNMEKKNKPDMESLNFLIGIWHTQGEVKGDGNAATTSLIGTDSYEWILNKNFILHKVDVSIGNEKTEAFEIIGVSDAKEKKYHFRSFDNQGVFTEMQGYIDEKGVLHIVGDKMRTTLFVNDKNNMTAHWEKSEDNKEWTPWMDVKLSK